jgi:hypothetical protein
MSVHTAIIDYRAPKEAILNLEHYYNICLFKNTHTYEAINGHPDICIFKGSSELIIAPNSPKILFDLCESNSIVYSIGTTKVGNDLKSSTAYNCVETDYHIIHKQGFTDTQILQRITHKPFLSITQAYTRCSLIYVGNKCAITSDNNIHTRLIDTGYSSLLCNPHGILLPPYKHGFIGGCFGMHSNTLFCIGNLDYLNDGKRIRAFLDTHNIPLIELYNGPLYDGGGIFFI